MTAKRRLGQRAVDQRQMELGLGSGERYRLFFAAMPPASVAAQVMALTQALQAEYGIDAQQHSAHVGLYGLDEYADGIPHDVIDVVSRAAASVRVRAFEAVFDGVQPFGGPRQGLVLRCGKGLYGFVALQNAIGIALAGAGADRPSFDSRFAPHLTLSEAGGKVPERTLDEPITWRVEKFSLILGLQGHKHYETYGEWPLQG